MKTEQRNNLAGPGQPGQHGQPDADPRQQARQFAHEADSKKPPLAKKPKRTPDAAARK